MIAGTSPNNLPQYSTTRALNTIDRSHPESTDVQDFFIPYSFEEVVVAPDAGRSTNTLRGKCRCSFRHPVRLVLMVAIVLWLNQTQSANAQVELLVRPIASAVDLRTNMGGPLQPGKNSEAVLQDALAVTPLYERDEPFLEDLPLRGAFRVAFADSGLANAALERMTRDNRIQFAQWNHRYSIDRLGPAIPAVITPPASTTTSKPTKSDDIFSDSLSHFPLLGVEDAWRVTRGDSAILVGLIDTGVYFEHPDLAGQFWTNRLEDTNGNGIFDASDANGIDDDLNGFVDDVAGYDFVDRPRNTEAGDYRVRDPDPSDDGSGHGTSVAGVIGARDNNSIGIAGIAPGVRLVILRAFGRDGRGDDDDIAAAIVYAADNGVDVLNLSFGDSYYSPLMHASIRYASAKGVTVVASAGNVGGDNPHYPSDYPEVISTVWLDASGNGPAGRATYGVGVDVGAPGSQVFTTLMPLEVGASADSVLYGRQSGSSMAAPMISATAALLRSIDRSLTPQSIRSIITVSAVDIGDRGWDHRTGAGRVNTAAAVLSAMPARALITEPVQNRGVAGNRVSILGTVVSPSLRSYSLSFAVGDQDLVPTSFTGIAGPTNGQVLNDTLGVWNTSDLVEGIYTLRLTADTDAGPLEDRRRIIIDRSNPVVTTRSILSAFVGGLAGVHADVESDDLTTARLEISSGVKSWTIRSDRESTRHGITWTNTPRIQGSVLARVYLVNTAGLQTIEERIVQLPYAAPDALTIQNTNTGLGHGFLLPFFVDLDEDGLSEIVFNSYENGWLGDTLTIAEFAPDVPRIIGQLATNIFPRDVGDTDGDGYLELLGQVSAATIILEQTDASAFPSTVAFVDTTGLNNPTSVDAVWGARLTDLDQDGKVELLSHNTRSFRVLEFDGSGPRVTGVLDNNTSVGGELNENTFQQPEALVGDFDGDGKTEVVVGDSDGDWIIFEAESDDNYQQTWAKETNRYNAGARFAAGDLDGDGVDELLLSTTNWIGQRSDGVYEPDVAYLYIVRAVGDNDYALIDSLALPGESSQHNGLASVDMDGDGRDEIIVLSIPDLYVFRYVQEWSMVFHWGRTLQSEVASGARSAKITTGDLDGDRMTDLIVAGGDGFFHRLEMSSTALQPSPQWIDFYPRNMSTVQLTWHSPLADSVLVYGATPNEEFNIDTVAVSINSVELKTQDEREYFLVGYNAGMATSASRIVAVRPHDPATAIRIDNVDANSIALLFSIEMDVASVSLDSIALTVGGDTYHPASVISSLAQKALVFRFESPVGSGELRWSGLTSYDGAPAQSGALPVIPDETSTEFFVKSWVIEDHSTVRIVFSLPVDGASTTNLANYTVLPFGSISAVDPTAETNAILLHLEGIVTGPTGLNASLTVLDVRSVDGVLLARDGNVISLSSKATNLDEAYVYPNPVDPSRAYATIGGIPFGTSVEVLGASGSTLVRLTENSGSGGVRWDLRNDRGEIVSSGVYLIRVFVDDQEPRLIKVAVIR